MDYLNKEEILGAQDIGQEDVPVPEWKGTVRVRGLTGEGRDKYIASLSRQQGTKVLRNPTNATAKLVALCIVDASGQRMFGAEHVQMLGKKSGAALDRVFEVASRLSGLSEEDIEEIKKDSENILSDDSTSGSPNDWDTP